MIIRCPFSTPDINYHRPLHEAVFQHCPAYGNRPALLDTKTGQRISFTEVMGLAANVATTLRNMNAQRGEVLAVCMVNHIHFAPIFLGSTAWGITVTGINPNYTADEIREQLVDSKARYIVSGISLRTKLDRAIAQLPTTQIRRVWLFRDRDTPAGHTAAFPQSFSGITCQSARELLAGSMQPNIISHSDLDPAKDIAILPYSSGTTGKPKGVMLSHEALSSFLGTGHFDIGNLLPNQGDLYAAILPFFHVGGIYALIASLHRGSTFIIIDRYDRFEFCRLIEELRVNHIWIVPSVLTFLVKDPAAQRFDLSSLEKIVFGAAPSGPELVRMAKGRFPALKRLCQNYGLTETGMLTATPAAPLDEIVSGSVGQPLSGVCLQIVSTDGQFRQLNCGESGEVLVKGPGLMSGYLGTREKTESMYHNGWLRTGDIGKIDPAGNLYITDRLKELIKYKGLQIAPAELEDIILKHPSVQEVAVVGVDPSDNDDNREIGQVPRAYVVLKQADKHGDWTKIGNEILDYIGSGLAPHKQLRGGIVFINEIPKGGSGKMMKKKLVTMSNPDRLEVFIKSKI